MDHIKRPKNIKFRVLIIGRANAGKTSILQRVCDTTESPKIYRRVWESEQLRAVQLDPTTERGEHDINDELTFTNHDGYVFHDSRGIESGSDEELGIIQKFVQKKSRMSRLTNRLHAIWYCIPMDNRRPYLDMKYFHDVCPDKNVPVIAVFTKYDQFKDDIEIDLERAGCANWETEAHAEAERVFQEQFLYKLGGTPHFVRLENMHEAGKHCNELLEKTADGLNDNVVSVMLLAVQKGNLERSIRIAVKRACTMFRNGEEEREKIIGKCLMASLYLWFDFDQFDCGDALCPDLNASASLCFCCDVPSAVENDDYKQTVSLLKSFVETNKFSLHYHDIHHIMIAVTLILDHATFLLTSVSSQKEALLQAQSQYIQFQHLSTATQFPAVFQEYSDEEFIQFILKNRLLP